MTVSPTARCDHCKELAPEYETAAVGLQSSSLTPLFASVDATVATAGACANGPAGAPAACVHVYFMFTARRSCVGGEGTAGTSRVSRGEARRAEEKNTHRRPCRTVVDVAGVPRASRRTLTLPAPCRVCKAAAKYKITSFPTLLLFSDGKKASPSPFCCRPNSRRSHPKLPRAALAQTQPPPSPPPPPAYPPPPPTHTHAASRLAVSCLSLSPRPFVLLARVPPCPCAAARTLRCLAPSAPSPSSSPPCPPPKLTDLRPRVEQPFPQSTLTPPGSAVAGRALLRGPNSPGHHGVRRHCLFVVPLLPFLPL